MFLNPKHEIRNTKQIQNSNFQNPKQKQHYMMYLSFFCFDHFNFGHLNLFETPRFRYSDFEIIFSPV